MPKHPRALPLARPPERWFGGVNGIVGAMTATPLLNLLGLRDFAARGFAVGVAAHGIGTTRAFQVNELAGVFAGIGIW